MPGTTVQASGRSSRLGAYVLSAAAVPTVFIGTGPVVAPATAPSSNVTPSSAVSSDARFIDREIATYRRRLLASSFEAGPANMFFSRLPRSARRVKARVTRVSRPPQMAESPSELSAIASLHE